MKQFCDKCGKYTEWGTGGCSCNIKTYVTDHIVITDKKIDYSKNCEHRRAMLGDSYCRDCGKRLYIKKGM